MRRRTALTRIGGAALGVVAGSPAVAGAKRGNRGGNGRGRGHPGDVVVPDDYSSVQAAVDAADAGDTVLVDGGTYVEEVRIGKDLTLSGRDGATIRAPATPTERGIVRAEGDVRVTVEGLVIDGAGNGRGGRKFWGIVYDGARGSIERNTVTRVREDPLSGNQAGTGIYVAESPRVAIHGNEVSDYQKTGILVSGTDTRADVTSNTVSGVGATDVIAQNGIDMDTAGGSVKFNVVTDHGYDAGNPVVGAGIITSPADDIDIKRNALDNNEAGIFPVGDGNRIQRNEIANGRATGSDDGDWAVVIFGDNNKVVNNAITDYETGSFLLGENNKFVNNRFEQVDDRVVDAGSDTKVRANREQRS